MLALMNSCSAISLLVEPSAARLATRDSCGVRSNSVPGFEIWLVPRLREVRPALVPRSHRRP